TSPSLPKSIAEEVIQVRDVVDLLDCRFEIVLHPPVADRLAVVEHVTGPRVKVPWLADRADVAKRLATVEFVVQVDVIWGEKLHALREDPRYVRVSLEAILLHQRENLLHLALVVNVFGEDVFIERVAGRAVDVQGAVLAERPGPVGKELPALFADLPGLCRLFE